MIRTFSCYIWIIFSMMFMSCQGSKPGQNPIQNTLIDRQLADLNQAITNAPSDGKKLFARAKYHYDQQTFDRALDDIQAALKIDSTNISYKHFLADTYLNYYRSREALATMRQCVKHHPEDLASKLKLVEFLIILKQNEEALATISDIMKIDKSNAEAHFLLGLIYRAEEDEKRAINMLQRSVELDADMTDAWIILGNIYELRQDPIALQYYSNAISSDPKNVFALHSKAFYLQNRDDIPGAIDLYDQLLAVDPTYEDAHLNRAILHIETRELDLAEAEFLAFKEMTQDKAIPLYYLGIVSTLQSEIETAKSYFQQALDLKPDYQKAKMALEKLGG